VDFVVDVDQRIDDFRDVAAAASFGWRLYSR